MNFDEELLKALHDENLAILNKKNRSKSFLFKTHMKYTIYNLVPDQPKPIVALIEP